MKEKGFYELDYVFSHSSDMKECQKAEFEDGSPMIPGYVSVYTS